MVSKNQHEVDRSSVVEDARGGTGETTEYFFRFAEFKSMQERCKMILLENGSNFEGSIHQERSCLQSTKDRLGKIGM